VGRGDDKLAAEAERTNRRTSFMDRRNSIAFEMAGDGLKISGNLYRMELNVRLCFAMGRAQSWHKLVI
jgi:hypothetical protein